MSVSSLSLGKYTPVGKKLVSLPYRRGGRPFHAPFGLFSGVSPPESVLWYLRLEPERSSGVSVLTVAGRVSHRTAPDLETALESITRSPGGGVVLDLSGVDYISSAGLRAVETAASRVRASGHGLVVCGLRDAVSVAFDLAGLSSAVAIEESREQAIEKAARTV
jgi:anti-anti-sigma factor